MSASDPVGRLWATLGRLPSRLHAETDFALRQIGDETVAAIQAQLAAKGEGDGALARSLASNVDADGRVVVTASHPAAAFLEYGTRTMAARPFLRPAVTATEAAALEVALTALARAVSATKDRP